MKKGMISYLAFTSRAYRLVLFALVPAFLIAANVVQAVLAGSGHQWFYDMSGVSLLLVPLCMMFIEVFMDHWVFGGIALKEGNSLEYMKTSARGRQMMRAALRMDMIRMFVEDTAVMILCNIAWIAAGGKAVFWELQEWVVILDMAVGQYLITVTALLIVRHFDFIGFHVTAISVATVILILLNLLYMENGGVALIVLAILSVIVSVFSQWKIMRRVEGSYYDGKPESLS